MSGGLLAPRGDGHGAAAGTTTPGTAAGPGKGSRDPFPPRQLVVVRHHLGLRPPSEAPGSDLAKRLAQQPRAAPVNCGAAVCSPTGAVRQVCNAVSDIPMACLAVH
ncbi:unnamed protein product [Urochloa humidicola]